MMRQCSYITGFLVSLVSLLVTPTTRADISGFIAQGIVYSEQSSYIDPSERITTELTEAGLNITHSLSDHWHVSAQVIYLDSGNRYASGARVDYAFLEYRTVFNEKWQGSAQVGRFKNQHWLYSATRDVPQTRPTIILPQSIYFDGFRDVAISSDGISAELNYRISDGEWRGIVSYGNSPVDEMQREKLFSPLATGKLRQDDVLQFSAYFIPYSQDWQFGVSLLDSDFSYQQSPNDFYVDGVATSQRFLLHGQYFAKDWELSSEIMRERGIYKDAIAPGFYSDTTGDGGYLQGRWFITPAHTLIARMDWYDLNSKDRRGELYEANGLPGYFSYMDTATLGWQWRFADGWQVHAEWHWHKGRGRLTPQLLPNVLANPEEYWQMGTLQLSYWFTL